jgi:organic radical activating enzyme
VDWDISSLLKALTSLEGYSASDVLVVTGGEPTLQRNLITLMNYAVSMFKAIQIETNGTQSAFFAEPAFQALPKVRNSLSGRHGVYTVVSPKAIYKAGTTPKPSAAVLTQADCLKFVLSAEEGPHHTVPPWVFESYDYGIPVYVSPMAVYNRAPDSEVASIWDDSLINRIDTAANYAYAAEYAMKHNLLLSLQTHLFTAVP